MSTGRTGTDEAGPRLGDDRAGPLAWMARNRVAANLVMVFLIVGGLMTATNIKQEVFPEVALDLVIASVAYPGASPAEVEQGICLAIEDQVRGLDGVKRVTSFADEGSGGVAVELLIGADVNEVLQDVKNAVDRIRTFPENAERPVISVRSNRNEAASLAVSGDQDDRTLRQMAERVRDELLQRPQITLVELGGVRPLELSIEVPQANLRAYNLTLGEIAGEVRRAAVELPGGGVKTGSGEVLLRMAERRDFGHEFADIAIRSLPDGTDLTLGSIANIVDGFADTDDVALYNGKPAAAVYVYRVGDQSPVQVVKVVEDYLEELQPTLPPGIHVEVWRDWSQLYRDRMNLLLRNAAIGLALVLVLLGLFLEARLAFWVTMGLPTSFLGSLLIIQLTGVSINMISMFAFIMALGMVVDDAIIVGESIYEMRQEGVPFLQAAIRGAHQVSVPVTFAVLTNIVAFLPMTMMPGFTGKMLGVIPVVIIPVFTISLVESLLILPAHRSHEPGCRGRSVNAITHPLRHAEALLRGFIHRVYAPVLRLALRWRYIGVATGVSVLALTVGFVKGGRIDIEFMHSVEGDEVTASATLPYGVPVEEAMRVRDRLVQTAHGVLDRHGGEAITENVYAQIGESLVRGHFNFGGGGGGSHNVTVMITMVGSEHRDVSASDVSKEWRAAVGDMPGLEALSFGSRSGPSAGQPIHVELSHASTSVLEEAASDLARQLRAFDGVKDIDDGFARGKPQLSLKLRPEARSLGVPAGELGRPVRDAFYGAEALRQQRGRDEIKVMVRLPEDERQSEYSVEELLIRTRDGGEIPRREAAEVVRGRAYTSIQRTDGRRVMNVTADLEEGVVADGILSVLTDTNLPELMHRYPGLTFAFSGQRRDQMESMQSLGFGFAVAMIAIFAMLAIPLKSYVQPLIVMAAIPFGMVGAVIGHVIMGYSMSIISMMGIVALAGVVVNDSLVLIHTTNEKRREGATPLAAISAAGVRRFRPIMLTSLTTFFGLAPMIFETSVQARFLVPMALSLGYGVLFATFITLLLVPSLYLIIEDLRKALDLVGRGVRWSLGAGG